MLQETVNNLLALAPAELEEYRDELVCAPADDPNLAHDREALRRAEAIIRRRIRQEEVGDGLSLRPP